MTRITIPMGNTTGGTGTGTGTGTTKVQLPGSSAYINAPIYVGPNDPAGTGAVEPYAWIDSDATPTSGSTSGGTGTVSGISNVTGSAPITSSGGPTPSIGINAASTTAAGSMSSADKLKLDGITAGAAPAPAATSTVSGTIRLTGDLGGSSTAPTVPALATRLQVVAYGAAAATARPSGVPNGGVYWIGTSTTLPANALPADLVYLP